MWIASLVFLTVGLSDLARARDNEWRWRNLIACLVLGLAPLIALAVVGAIPYLGLLGGGLLLVAWHITTSRDLIPERFALLPVVALGLIVVAALAATTATPSIPAPLADWYASLPYWFVESVSPERASLLVGYTIFLVNSANFVVMSVLALAGSRVRQSVHTIRGGRIIGPLERVFIFWMAVAGQFLALGAIIAAKGILRYPEISERSKNGKGGDRGALAEYVLIGSLVSWSVAFLMVPVY